MIISIHGSIGKVLIQQNYIAVTVPTFLQPVIQSWVAWLSFTFIAIPVSTFFLIWDFPKSIWRLLFSDYPKVVLITGANSGIGAELALAYARPNTTIGLIAHRLNNVATACKKKGATIRVMSCDITNLEDLNRNIDEFDEANPIELLIANAAQIGITTDQELSDQWEDLWHRYFEVNVVGTLATVMTTYKKMRDRGKGQIANDDCEFYNDDVICLEGECVFKCSRDKDCFPEGKCIYEICNWNDKKTPNSQSLDSWLKIEADPIATTITAPVTATSITSTGITTSVSKSMHRGLRPLKLSHTRTSSSSSLDGSRRRSGSKSNIIGETTTATSL
ncbi:22372_t:CDS:2 [Entrophospora sp. SA101]|nr:22372_t:CDS:2 [Entrophospora sp. SA101]